MSDLRLVVDVTACIFGWGPCVESYGFSHSCKKRAGHKGRHVCEICGASAVLRNPGSPP